MSKYAYNWHKSKRNELISRFPAVKSLISQHKKQTLVSIILIPILYLLIAILCVNLNYIFVIVVAWTFGALLRMRIFNNMHEICHSLYPRPSIRKNRALLIYSNLWTITSDYSYYRWTHMSHHRLLGAQSLETVVNDFKNGKPVDGDVFDLSLGRQKPSFAQIRLTDNEQILKSSKLTSNMMTRIFLIAFLRPMSKIMYEIIAYLRVPLYASVIVLYHITGRYFLKYPSYNVLREVIIVRLLSIFCLVGIYQLGGINSIFFLILSDLFYRGFFLHPCAAFFLATHKSHESNECQPTSSVYGSYMTLFCGGVNYHTEHHDFPELPVSQLKNINKICFSHYSNIAHYKGAIEVLYDYIKNGDNWLYACQSSALKTD